ncbi:MAG TPA: hypothetical protein VIV55_09865 [Flavobacterium sp.]
MITEFNFVDEWNTEKSEWLVFYAENFPVDLKIGDEIWIRDFIKFFKKGAYYCPENGISNEFLKDLDIHRAKVRELDYAMQDEEVVKRLELKSI